MSGGGRSVVRSLTRSTTATSSRARRDLDGTCWNLRGNRLNGVLQVGDRAPDFKLPTTSGQELSLDDALQKHRSLIFLFYVLDFTGG